MFKNKRRLICYSASTAVAASLCFWKAVKHFLKICWCLFVHTMKKKTKKQTLIFFKSCPLLNQGERNSCRNTKAKHLDWFLVVLRLNCSHVQLMLPSELPGDRLLWARPASSNYSASCSKGKAVDWKEIWHGDVAATDKDVCWTIKKKRKKKRQSCNQNICRK